MMTIHKMVRNVSPDADFQDIGVFFRLLNLGIVVLPINIEMLDFYSWADENLRSYNRTPDCLLR